MSKETYGGIKAKEGETIKIYQWTCPKCHKVSTNRNEAWLRRAKEWHEKYCAKTYAYSAEEKAKEGIDEIVIIH